MSDIEDRLAAALKARTDLVRPEDLRPMDVPDTGLAWFRRPVTYALAAVACAAAISVPFVVNGAGDEDSNSPAATSTPSATDSASPPSEGTAAPGNDPRLFPVAAEGITVGESFTADLDGGPPETISLDGTASSPSLTVESVDSESGVSLDAAITVYVATTLVDLGRAGQGLLVSLSGFDSADMQLYRLVEGDLVLVEPTTNSVRFGHAGTGSADVTWLSTSGELFTRRPVAGPPKGFRVWRWHLDGDMLAAEPLDPVCINFRATPITWGACP